MPIIAHKSCIRTIRGQDVDFMIFDGPIVAPRAGFEINKECPSEYKLIIAQCINNGWLKPVACVKDEELMWDRIRG